MSSLPRSKAWVLISPDPKSAHTQRLPLVVELLTGQYSFRAGYWENRRRYDWLSFSSLFVRSLSLVSCRIDCDWNIKVIWTTVISNTHKRHKMTCTMSHHLFPWIQDTKKMCRGEVKKRSILKEHKELILSIKPSNEDIQSKIRCEKNDVCISVRLTAAVSSLKNILDEDVINSWLLSIPFLSTNTMKKNLTIMWSFHYVSIQS